MRLPSRVLLSCQRELDHSRQSMKLKKQLPHAAALRGSLASPSRATAEAAAAVAADAAAAAVAADAAAEADAAEDAAVDAADAAAGRWGAPNTDTERSRITGIYVFKY